MVKKTEAEIVAMEEEARAFRAEQAAVADKETIKRNREEAKQTKPLVDFVQSDQYKQFVKDATAVRDKMIGHELVTHLSGALISLGVVDQVVGAAVSRYTAAEAAE